MSDNRILKKGELLFQQGDQPEKIYLLQSGEIEILHTAEEFIGLNKSIVMDKGIRVCTIKGKTMLLGFSGLLVSKYSKSARAVTDSEITEYSLGQEGFNRIVQSDIAGSINMLRQVFNIFMQSHSQFNKVQSLFARLNQIDDNLSLIYSNLSSGGPEFLKKKSEDISFIFGLNKGKLPDIITADFVIEDKSGLLKKSYAGKSIDDVIDKGYIEIIKRVLRLDAQIIGAMIKSDPAIGSLMFSSVASAVDKILDSVHEIMEKIDQKAKILFGSSDSWAIYFAKMNGIKTWTAAGRLSQDFFVNLGKINTKLNSIYFDVRGKSLNVFGGYGEFMDALDIVGAPKNEPVESANTFETPRNVSAVNVVSTGLQKSIFQIFEFSMVEKEFQDRLLKFMNDYRNMINSSAPVQESDARKLRRFITQLYWELYQQVFVRSKIASSMPNAVKLMLNFGFLDDRLLEPEHLVDLNDLVGIRERETELSILLETEFLSKIYAGEEEPSITEMGLTYDAFIREQDKTTKKGKDDEPAAKDSNDANLQKTLHEIMQRLKGSAAVCSGSTVTAFPILTADAIKGSLKNMYVPKSKLDNIAKKLIDLDFSLFYRETVLRLDAEAREVIFEEILPYIILIPIAGSKSFLWQELSGNNKRSMGRFVVPILFNGDLEKSLAHSFACFRWELTKNVKGAMWADPIEGGVTGEYFDYVNTFKKNPKFTPEMKEKINLKFKTLRTNRDRFADDYLLWMEYEKDGIMKLNNVVREMFYKYIPFKKEIRDNLENMPAFNKFATRYNNIQRREYASYERKFKKYQDSSGAYPEEIQAYLDYLKM